MRARARNSQIPVLVRMPRQASIIIMLLWLCFSTACQADAENLTVEEWLTFTGAEDNVAIDYPADWKMYPGDEARGNDDTLVVDFVYQAGFTRGASVSVFHRSRGPSTLEDVAAWGEAQIIEIEERYALGELEFIEIGESQIPALTRAINVDTDTILPHRLKHVYIASDSGAYVVSFMAPESQFDDFAGVFDTMIASLRIIEETE